MRRASKTFEAAALAFYDQTFLDVVFSDPDRHRTEVRRAITALLAGDVFDRSFDLPSKIASRMGSLAKLVERR